MVRTCRVASYHGAPFSCVLPSNHLSISNRRSLCSDTAIDDKIFRSQERLNTAIWRYMGCVYRLAGCTAADILVHLPASFSSWLNDILGCQLLPVGSPLVSAVCPQARRTCIAPYCSQRLGRPGLWWAPVSTWKDHKVTAAVKVCECQSYRLAGCLLGRSG